MLENYSLRRLLTIGIVAAMLVIQFPGYSISADSTLSVVTVFIDQGSRIHPGSSREDVVAVFGPPSRVDSRDVPNAHHPVFLDRVHTFHYPGMVIRFYEAMLAGKEFVVDIAVNSDRYQPLSPLKVGSTTVDVERFLGLPHISYNNIWIYDEMHAGLGRVCLRMKDGAVQAILWQFYFD